MLDVSSIFTQLNMYNNCDRNICLSYTTTMSTYFLNVFFYYVKPQGHISFILIKISV